MSRRYQSVAAPAALARLAACTAIALGAATPALGQSAPAQPPAAPAASPGSHRVSNVRVAYVRDNPGHPAVELLMQATVEVVETPDGFAPPVAGQQGHKISLAQIASIDNARFTDEGLALLPVAVFDKLRGMGLVGVYVTPDAAQFRVADGRVVDTRQAGDTSLTLQVTTGVVTDLRTVGAGERLPADQTVNNKLHDRIRENSPVKPYKEGDKERSDLLRRDTIDDYVYFLNRHPGRKVDVAVAAPGETPGAVTLDYIVTENRPWLIFGQLSNTGTVEHGGLREHVGFIHNDLTNADDILSIDYQTENVESSNAVTGTYDRPFSNPRLRWNVLGDWYSYNASNVGVAGQDFEGEGWDVAAGLSWNF